MKTTKLSLKKTKINGKIFWQVTVPRQEGGRTRRTFKDRKEAQDIFKQAEIQLTNHGTAALSISDRLRSEAVEADKLLKPHGAGLLKAVEQYAEAAELLEPHGIRLLDAIRSHVASLQALKKSRLVEEAVQDYIAGTRSAGRSKRYIDDLNYRLGRFQRDFQGTLLSAISTSDIENWLRSLGLGAVSRNAFRRRLSALFGYAQARDWCMTNPIPKVRKAREHETPIGILTPEELSRLLTTSGHMTLPYWAIGAFAGIRSAELERLEWKNVDWTSELIEVPTRKSKTASRRLVKMESALIAWLAPYRLETGPICPPHLYKLQLEDRARAGITKWPPNALRHSFASYHLAHFKDAAKLALELGHTNARLIFSNYRELVKPTEAVRWWNIVPVAESNVVELERYA